MSGNNYFFHRKRSLDYTFVLLQLLIKYVYTNNTPMFTWIHSTVQRQTTITAYLKRSHLLLLAYFMAISCKISHANDNNKYLVVTRLNKRHLT